MMSIQERLKFASYSSQRICNKVSVETKGYESFYIFIYLYFMKWSLPQTAKYLHQKKK